MLDKFSTFIVLAECRSFTETARRLYCSQPTITQHIKQLENAYGAQLIQRTSREIELTEKGQIFLKYALQMQELHENLQHQMFNESVCNKPVTLYISHYIANYYFSNLFGSEQAPMLDHPYEINSYCYNDLRRCLFEKRTKFVVMPIYDSDEVVTHAFLKETLFEEEFFLILSAQHPLADRKAIYGRDLMHSKVFLPQSFYLQQEIKQALHVKGILVQYIQMTNFEIIKNAVSQNLGIAFLPLKLVNSSDTDIRSKRVQGLTIKRRNGIVYDPHEKLEEQEKVFFEHITKELSKKASLA